MMNIDTLDAQTRAILSENHFATLPFERLARELAEGRLDPGSNRLDGPVQMLPTAQLRPLPEQPSGAYDRLSLIGRRAIEAGRVGAVVLNGGMATRFGGTAKGVARAFTNRSFLDLKLSQIKAAGQGRVPALLMNSFSTDAVTRQHLEELRLDLDVRCFTQMVSLRLTERGELFLGKDGKPSLHAPGHGDFPYALAASGQLARFIESGGEYLTLSNVDNLGASLDPAVIGAHIDGGRPMTVELVDTWPGDVGGFPAIVNGKATIVEAFRAPQGVDPGSSPVFNTNTFVFDAAALRVEAELSWFAVLKNVEGRKAVQFERLVGQLADFVPVTWLKVPRSGGHSRFVPIKLPTDLETSAQLLHEVLTRQGVL
ncbi:MAG: UTP--glucose-1-phosphate uridylyltransferase [Myxococcota bacterium]|jgi:UTP--glucose-1-phosphate uridylyltransferase|nr:UTP--glucose-1-phosphate uridylyltransferase [Myxococcota bacterium]